MYRLEKLAPLRIDPSSLEFPQHGPEFRGGYGIVSRALLSFSFDNITRDQVEQSGGRNLKSNDHTSKAEGHNYYREGEELNNIARPKEEAPEGQEQDFDGETLIKRPKVSGNQALFASH